MKLIRFGPAGFEKPGVLAADGSLINASSITPDFDESFFATDGLARLETWLQSPAGAGLPHLNPAGVRLGPPIARPSKIICVGLNYRDHAAETGAALPTEPVLFMKATSAICGPFDPIVL